MGTSRKRKGSGDDLLTVGLVAGGFYLAAKLFGASGPSSAPARRRPEPVPSDEEIHRLMEGQLERVLRVAPECWFDVRVLAHPGADAAYSDGRDIHYSPAWVREQVAKCPNLECARAKVVGVIAHELAHIIFRHPGYTPNVARNHGQELAADHFVGEVYERLGYTPEDYQAIVLEFERRPSVTHPPPYIRAKAVADGYLRARGRR